VNLQDISAHWVALHEALGVGAPITDDSAYERALAFVEQVFESGMAEGPLAGLVAVVGDRIREYEDRAHPWPETATPASVLRSLMDSHGLRQVDLPEVGSQGVISEILAGRRALNARQVAVLARRFGVPAEVFLPA
jgi:HTH-type transcriptional regulator / antitoxin HigA